jgi:PAS domain S-box-containing protein
MVHVNDIATWRERIFTSLLPVVLVVGTLATASIVPILIDHGMWPVLLIDSLALVWIFFIWRLKHLPYTLRVVNFLAVIYTLSIGLMLTVGAASLSYLLGPPVVAAILLGTRPAIIALALGAASIIGLGATDHITLNVPGWEHEPLKASLVAASNYLSVGAMLSLTCGTLLKGLSQTLAEVRGVAATLETNQAALHELNSELALTSAAVARLNDMVLIARAVDGWDADQPITFVNDAFLRRTGYAREEVVGQSLRMLQAADADQAVVARIVAAIAARTPCNAELMAHTREGTPFWVEVEMVPFARGAR